MKTIEIRTYNLGYRSIALANKDVFLVQTKSVDDSEHADLSCIQLPPRSQQTEIVGIIQFSHARQYAQVHEFQADRSKHRIAARSQEYDWKGGRREAPFAWHIASVQRLATPVPVRHQSGNTGWTKPVPYEVVLLPSAGQASTGTSASRPGRKRNVVEEAGTFGLEPSTLMEPTGGKKRAVERRGAQDVGGPQSGAAGSMAQASRLGPLTGQQQLIWPGFGPLPVADLESRVRRELDEAEKLKYKDNRFLAKIAADWSNSKRDEIRRRIWTQYMQRRR